MINKKNKQIIVAVSGGFDPLHIGHVRLFQSAKKLGDKLIVLINNDNWIMKKKGYVFMLQQERKEIIQALECVDRVVFTSHLKNPKNMSVAKDLKRLKPHIFANGGDRKIGNLVSAEDKACSEIGCNMVLEVGRGGKVQSSSWLLSRYTKKDVGNQ